MRFPPNLQPIAHVTPRPRIDLWGPCARSANVEPIEPVDVEECERIWRLVKLTAEGTNMSWTTTEDAE